VHVGTPTGECLEFLALPYALQEVPLRDEIA
jgi:hypothetical protein